MRKSAAKKSSPSKKKAPAKKAPPANVVRVPRAKTSSFDPDRKLDRNQLLKTQVLHFAEMNYLLPKKLRCEIPLESIQTEGEAAEYIRHIGTHLAAGRGVAKTRKGTA